jgi:hypothetical protein
VRVTATIRPNKYLHLMIRDVCAGNQQSICHRRACIGKAATCGLAGSKWPARWRGYYAKRDCRKPDRK